MPAGIVVVVRAPGQELPQLPAGVEVVADAREGLGPVHGLLAGLEAVDAEVAFVASTDMPFLHPQFVAAVCGAARGADAAVPHAESVRNINTEIACDPLEPLAEGDSVTFRVAG